MESIGDYLRRERELRNIPLEEVAEATKIHIGTLKAIEEGQTELLPAEVFVRGFIRCYAEYIGLDPNDVLLRYPQAKQAQQAEHISLPSELKVSHFPPRYGKYLWTSMLILISVLVLGIIVYIGWRPSSIPPKPQKAVSMVGQKSIPSASANTLVSVQANAAQTAQKEFPNSTRHVLRAIFKEDTWIQTIIDEQALREYYFRAGETFAWAINDRISLRIGNAGGAELYFDDKPLKPLGNSGEVVSVTLPNPH